jgi:cation diffusion facilitator CzcD-associated flavoprotein CzcO
MWAGVSGSCVALTMWVRVGRAATPVSRVVIIGGGFGGVYVARELEALRSREDFEIILLARERPGDA